MDCDEFEINKNMFVTNDPTPRSKLSSNYLKSFRTPSEESEVE